MESADMEERLSRAKQYRRQKDLLAIIQIPLSAVFLIFILLSGLSALLKDTVASWSDDFYLQVSLYLAILAVIYYLLFAALEFYDSFLLEHKFLLSNQTVIGWLKKNVKMGLVSLMMLWILGKVLYFFLRHFQDWWWLPTTAAWLLFTIVLGKITPTLIIPAFYKCSPLANSGLKERLLKLSKNCGAAAKDVFEIQLSKETKKANALVAGLGKGRRILLADTLLKSFSDDQIEAVFAHELGHIRLLHTWKIIGFGTAVSLAGFYVTHLLLEKSITPLGFEHIYDIAAFPVLSLILMVMGLMLMPVQNWYSRHLEKQADMFTIRHIQNRDSYISAITKLGEQNLSDPSPGKFVELFLYTHPPIAKRLRYIGEKNGKGAQN